MKLLLTLNDMSPIENQEINKSISISVPNIEIENHSGIGVHKRIGDIDIVGISTIVSAVVSVITLIWTVKPKKSKETLQIIKESEIELSNEYQEQIAQIYETNGGKMTIIKNSKVVYQLRIMSDGNNLSVYGERE